MDREGNVIDVMGLKGERGSPGETGPAGPRGESGADGKTPHIGENGNWFIGDTDTGVPAGGEGGASGVITETDPTVFAWAKSHLPFTTDQLSDMASGAGFYENPTNFADGKTYFRYHAGATSFTWTNPNQQTGAVTITVLAWSQYRDKTAANQFSRLVIVYGDGSTEYLWLTNGQTVSMTTDASKVLTEIRGNYDHENWVLLDMSVLSIVADYPAPTGTVKSVNGIEPDEAGNVEIDIPDSTDANAVHYTAETPTKEQQMQARENLELYREDIEVTEEKEVTVELDSSNSEGTITGEIDMTASNHGGVWHDGDIIRVILGDYTFDGTVTLAKVDPWTYGCSVTAYAPVSSSMYRELEYDPVEMVWYVSGGGYDLDLEETEIMRVYRIVRHVVPDDYIPDTIARKTELPGEMSGATAETDGASGLVPAPAAGDNDKFLSGDGTWKVPESSGGGTDLSLGVTGATVGQTVRITAVDDSGKPTAWEAVDGEKEWKLLRNITLPEDPSTDTSGIEWTMCVTDGYTGEIASFAFSTDENGETFAVRELLIFANHAYGKEANYFGIADQDGQLGYGNLFCNRSVFGAKSALTPMVIHVETFGTYVYTTLHEVDNYTGNGVLWSNYTKAGQGRNEEDITTVKLGTFVDASIMPGASYEIWGR